MLDKTFQKLRINKIKDMSEDESLSSVSLEFLKKSTDFYYSYNFDAFGLPIIQYPQDIIAIQELVWSIKPDLIIETGIARGGSIIMNASLLALLDMCDAIESGETINPLDSKRKVIGIDIDIRKENKKAIQDHKMFSRIEMIEGSSISPNVVSRVHEVAQNYKKILVCLDSSHSHDHVLAELNSYASLTSIGSYCVVFDTIIEDLPNEMFNDRPWGVGNNPKTAVWEYLRSNSNFEIDKKIQEKLLITVAPDGYLKRIN